MGFPIRFASLLALCLLAFGPDARACGMIPPPPPPPPPVYKPPKGVVDPKRGPVDPPPTPPPNSPTPPVPSPGTPIIPGAGTSQTPASGRRGSPSVAWDRSWRIWWDLNREALLGLRGTLPRLEPESGSDAERTDLRTLVRRELRDVLGKATDRTLRATALRALGRAGTPDDAELLLRTFLTPGQESEVQEGAAIGLASLAEMPAGPPELLLRRSYDRLLAGWEPGSSRSRRVAILALSLRARSDPALALCLGRRCLVASDDAEDAAALLFSCGLAREPLLGGPVIQAALTGEFAGKRLIDVARSHAVLAAAMTGEAGTTVRLAGLLDGKTPVHTRRSVALALGMRLREGRVEADARDDVEKTMLRTLDDDHDPLVRGYLLLALGQARPPMAIDVLTETLTKRGDAVERPYAALALGLATWGLHGERAEAVQKLLAKELETTKELETSAALSIACGVAEATGARSVLLTRAADGRLNPSLRGPTFEALGVLGDPGGEAEKLMVAALDDANPEVVTDACIGLGLVGHSSSALAVVERLRKTTSDNVQAYMVVALSHLGGRTTVRPLLDVLADASLDPSIRAAAAAALGILVDPRTDDPLFEIDASTNPYGLTIATRELVRVY